jgi:hypothetical protein
MCVKRDLKRKEVKEAREERDAEDYLFSLSRRWCSHSHSHSSCPEDGDRTHHIKRTPEKKFTLTRPSSIPFFRKQLAANDKPLHILAFAFGGNVH